ncbi:FUSC family protein [Frondihabitans cladoniiphilus]|uniref:Integral membrane bound transporter domain-containing protein n=1 Tax=Frondihabitans cladoniiphilus TaxID=715785 RepID=A0ABP8W5X8_9MICO
MLLAGPLGLPTALGAILGALPAFICCFLVTDERPGREARRSAVFVLPYLIALFLSLELQGLRLVELVIMVGLLFFQFYGARIAPWGADAGIGAIVAFMSGLILPIPSTSFPELALLGVAGLALTIVLRALFFRPDARRSLARARRGYLAATRQVLIRAAILLESPDGRDHRARIRLDRAVLRVQEAAMLADGLIGKLDSGLGGRGALGLHRILFDTELDVLELGRIAGALRERRAGAAAAGRAAQAIRIVLDAGGASGREAAATLRVDGAVADPDLERLAATLEGFAEDVDEWRAIRVDLVESDPRETFRSAVTVAGGRVVGAGSTVKTIMDEAGRKHRIHLSPITRTALQALIAGAAVEPLAILLGGGRFYWGIIGVMVVFGGTNSTRDRVVKGWQRIWGTAVGGVVGIPLALLLQNHSPVVSLAIIMVCIALGMYWVGHRYALWTVMLVVALCQIYALTGAFSIGLIPLRLAENALGAAIAVLVTAVVFPIPHKAMIAVAVRHLRESVQDFLTALEGAGDGPSATHAARVVDQRIFQLRTVTTSPFTLGRGDAVGDDRLVLAATEVDLYVNALAGGPDDSTDRHDLLARLDEALRELSDPARA